MPPLEAFAQIADDIYQVRIPLPFALNLVNCYLLCGDDGWTIVDTGINTQAGQAVWEQTFAALHIGSGDVRQIVLTHVHPDHYGMAGWLQARFTHNNIAPPVKLSAKEAEIARMTWRDEGGRYEVIEQMLTACGLPSEMSKAVADGVLSTRQMTLPHPDVEEIIHAGDTLKMGKREFRIIHTPGHSDGQLLFYDAADSLILSGDQVLMKITPNIGLWPDTDPDPLARFLASLAELKSLDVRLALPGHKMLITDWHGRLDELEAHHQQRLDQTLAACIGGVTVYEASLKIFDSSHFSHHEWRFAMVETRAHLEYLVARRKLRREDGEVWCYYAAS